MDAPYHLNSSLFSIVNHTWINDVARTIFHVDRYGGKILGTY